MRGKTVKKPTLSSVRTPAHPAPTPPPRPLGEAGRRFWDEIVAAYGIADEGGREILAQACAALDRVEELAGSITRDGAVVQTRNGPREHPALRAELAGRAFVVRSIQRLGLDVKPIGRTGRPSGRF